MQTLQYADEIVFIDEPGIFEEPPYIEGRVQYVGPVLRPFEYGRGDRERARRELGLPADAVVLSVLPGQWSTEARAPLYDLLMPAFQALDASKKYLIWIAGDDQDMLAKKTKDIPGVIIKEKDWRIDRLMVACDLAIHKTNRKTAIELAALGIPSISVSYGLNRICDARLVHMPSNTALIASAIDSERLKQAIETILAAGDAPTDGTSGDSLLKDGRNAAAKRLADQVERYVQEERAASHGS